VIRKGTKVSDLRRLAEITNTPHPPATEPAPTPPRERTEPLVRYTAEVPKDLHRALKTFAMEQDTSTYAVTRALLTLLAEDETVAAQVRASLAKDKRGS
jgi:hypothetical protein